MYTCVLTFKGVEASSDSSSSKSELREVGESHLNALDAVLDLLGVAGEDLAEGDGGGVLAVGAADFYDGGELLGFGVEGAVEVLKRANERSDELVVEIAKRGERPWRK